MKSRSSSSLRLQVRLKSWGTPFIKKKNSKTLHDLDFDCVLFKFVSFCTSTALAIFSSPHGTYMSDLLFYHRPQTCIESKVLPLGQNDPTFVSGTITSNESWVSSCYSEAKQNFSGWVSNVLVWKWHMKSWTFIHSWGYGTEILSTTVRQAMQSSTVMAVWQYSCHWLKLWHNPSFIEKILFFLATLTELPTLLTRFSSHSLVLFSQNEAQPAGLINIYQSVSVTLSFS